MTMSIVRRVLQRFLKPLNQTYFVGRDLEGNKYYEYPNANDGRPKRTVQYKRTDDMWAYIASGKRLPVQWTAWLTHTRPNSPTIEELQVDLARQQRVQTNAAILEARDKEGRERMARPSQAVQPSHSKVPGSRLESPSEQGQNERSVQTRSDSPRRVHDPWVEANRGSDEPQSWSPVVRRK